MVSIIWKMSTMSFAPRCGHFLFTGDFFRQIKTNVETIFKIYFTYKKYIR